MCITNSVWTVKFRGEISRGLSICQTPRSARVTIHGSVSFWWNYAARFAVDIGNRHVQGDSTSSD